MQEVRVAQTGVQVLFGFLLTVPFTNRFDELIGAQRLLYFATLATAGAAAMLLIARRPAPHAVPLRREGTAPARCRVRSAAPACRLGA